jgi:hypothetical protein
MMECNELTNDALIDPASPAQRAHLDGCAACSARRAELRSLENDLAALGRALPFAANPALVRRIVARIPKQAAPASTAWRWAAGFAAAAAILLAVVLASRETPEAPRREMVSVPNRPPIETVLDPVPLPPASKPPLPAPAPLEPAPRVTPPVPPPTPVPSPPPVEPEKPAPAPAQPPKPATPPADTKPARVVLTIANAEGALELQEGAAWKKIAKSAEWDEAAGLRTTEKSARFTLPDGTRATLRPRSELRILAATPPSLSLEHGEAFFEVIPGVGRQFSIVTPDARVQVSGTQFSVRRNGHTEIVVSSGEVRVSNDKGETLVTAGNGTTARKASAPAKPKPVDTDAITAWRRAIDPPETPRFRYDFEDARKPLPWQGGKVVAGPARGLNRYCLEGSPGITLDLTSVDKRVSTVKGVLKVRFRYFAPAGDQLWVQLFNDRVRDNFRYDLKGIATGKWETFEVPLSEFYVLIDGAAKIQEGDRLSWFNVSVSGTNGPVYFDDIELVEILK